MKFFRMILPVLVLSLYLGVHNGNLALFREGNTVPIQVYPRAIATYPKEDQLALRTGIPITSKQQLAKLLEAYLS
jgi:hypothetical protein